ncbi:hypothetical protein VaNZ11_010509 [Volvox africanus]|uniref:Activating molecule in BECN1-regulated autophagy protein 1 n=1 Tax=Volvox africanus TaxID=51714 RepID=A0ABQ5SAX0_9CHLO|nr:hypothetical protein VaNZ11_010509 [Volvox africanus]
MKNIASLLLCRELNQSPSGRFNRGFEQSAVSRWAEEDFLQHSSSEYVEFRPPPRSSIAAAFSLDGRYLASTHGDHTVKVIDVRTGRLIHSLAGHRRTPWVVRFSPVDPDVMASGSLDSTAAIWQVSTGQMLNKYDFGKPIASLAFDPSGTMLVVSAGHKVFSWPFTRLAPPVKILKTRRSLRALHFHPTAPHILLTAEVTERRAGTTADGVGTAAAMAAATPPPQQAHGNNRNLNRFQQQQQRQQQAPVHSQLAWIHQAGGVGAGEGVDGGGDLEHVAPDDPDPQEAVDDLAVFIAAHNSMTPSQLQQQRQQSQQDVAQDQQAAAVGPRASAARNAHHQGAAPWPTGLLRNLLMGVTGIFTGSLGGGGAAGAGGGSAAGRGGTVNQQAADGARGVRGTGSSPTHGGHAAVAAEGGGPYVVTGAAFAGGGGAPSVNPGDGGMAWGNAHPGHSAPPGNAVATAIAPPVGGRLNVLAPAHIIRHHNMGGGIRHAIPLVAPPATAPLQSRALRGGTGRRLRDPHVAAYDLMWGWDHTQRMSESEIVRLRELALRAAPDLPSAANHDTPCIVTVRLWDFRDPTRELRKELLVLPRVVLCSEMGIHFTTCGRYMVCCVVRERPSEACLNWQAVQAAGAAQGVAATRTHAHPRVGSGAVDEEGQGGNAYCGCAGNLGEADCGAAGAGVGDMDDVEATHVAVGVAVGPTVTVAPAAGSPGSCRSVEMTDAEARPRGPPLHDGGGGGEQTVGWLGGDGGGETQEYDDEYLYDTATQAFGQEPRVNNGSGAAESAGWRGPHSGGSDGGNAGAGSPAISALSLQQRYQQQGQQQRFQEVHVRQQQHRHNGQPHTEDVEEARTEVSRPGAAAWEMEYDSATVAAYRKMASAASAISGVARGCGRSGGGAEEADGEGGEVRPHSTIRPSISLTHLGGAGLGSHLHHQQHPLHLVQSVNAVANKLSAHDPQISRGGAGSAAAPGAMGGDLLGGDAVQNRSRIPHETQRPEQQQPIRNTQRRHHQHQHQYDQQHRQQPIRWRQQQQHHHHQQQQQQPAHIPGRGVDRQPWPEGPRGHGGLSRTGWPPAGPATAAANAAPHGGGDSDAGPVHEGDAATASVGLPPAVQETPSTFASIKAHLALQRSRDGAATAGGMYGRGVSRDAGREGRTVAGPEAQHVAATTAPAAGVPTATTAATFGVPAAAAVGAGATQRNDAPTVAPGIAPVAGGPTATAAAVAAAQPSGGFRPCYELCIFFTGTSPIPPAIVAPADPAIATATVTTTTAAAAAAPSASSSVAFPMAPGLAGTGAIPLAAGGGSGAVAPSTTSVIGPHFGALLHARPVLAAHCMTSVQLSPAGDHVLVAYGRRHISLCSLVACMGQLAVVHSVVEIYSVPDLVLRRVLLSADDEVNVAVFNAFPAEGMAYGTKEGRLRLVRYDRRPPVRSAIPFLPTPPHLEDETWEAEHPEFQQQDSGKSMSVSDGEQQRPAV